MQTASIPAFLDYDAAVAQYWPRLAETFPDYQFCLVEKTSGAPVARGHSIPVAFNSSWSSLPDEGFDWALERGLSRPYRRKRANRSEPPLYRRFCSLPRQGAKFDNAGDHEGDHEADWSRAGL